MFFTLRFCFTVMVYLFCHFTTFFQILTLHAEYCTICVIQSFESVLCDTMRKESLHLTFKYVHNHICIVGLSMSINLGQARPQCFLKRLVLKSILHLMGSVVNYNYSPGEKQESKSLLFGSRVRRCWSLKRIKSFLLNILTIITMYVNPYCFAILYFSQRLTSHYFFGKRIKLS